MKQIPLTQGKFASVDSELYENLAKYKWSLDGSGYPQRALKTEKGWRPRRMHRDILGLIGREMADHIDGDKLNNTVANLRSCNAAGNVRSRGLTKANSSGFKGVHYNNSRKIYQAYITCNYKHIYIGAFSNAIDAALAYNKMAIKLYGEFAFLNNFLK